MTPTENKLLELIAEAGAPLTLDQMMDVLPYADRKDVGRLCRDLVQAGKLRSSVEDGRVAYDLANGVARIKPRTSSAAPLTNVGRIRQLLASAAKPLSRDEIQSSLPDMPSATVGKTLSNGAHRKLWTSTRRDDGIHVYGVPQAGAGSATAGAVATASASAAPAPAPAPASPVTPPPPVAESTAAMHHAAAPEPRALDLSGKLDEAVKMAEAACEAYVFSVVDHDIYSWLQQSVRAARAARDAFAGGAE